MTSKDLINKIDKMYNYFSTSKMRYSVLIDGVWGIGKTFSYNTFIKGKKNNNYYISLFGVSSLREIENEIIQKVLFPTFKKLNKNSIINVVSKIGIQCVENKSGINFSDIININKIENLSFSVQSLICFDDIERANEAIEFKELLGLIERLSKKTNIVILCNKSKLSDVNLKIFDEYQERVIDYYYYLDQLDDEFLEKLISDWGISKESVIALKNFFIENGEQNLRFLDKTKTLYQEIKIEYGKSNWFSQYETSILKAISYLVSEQFYGKLTEKYKKDGMALRKALDYANSEDLIIKELEKEIDEHSYFEAIPYEFKEIAVILNKFIKSATDITQEMRDYFSKKEIYDGVNEKIEYWFLENENSIKENYESFKEKFIENIQIFSIDYQLRGFLVLRRFQNTLAIHDELVSIRNQLKNQIKRYLEKEKYLEINWRINHYLIDREELEILEEIKKEAENELQKEKLNTMKTNILKLDFEKLATTNENRACLDDLNELNEFFDIFMYGQCPIECWKVLSSVLRLLTGKAREDLLIKVEANINSENNLIIKSRNKFLKERILRLN